MKKNIFFFNFIFFFFLIQFLPGNISINFDGDIGKNFAPIVGFWHKAKDGNNSVYVIEGRKWKIGTLSNEIYKSVKEIYGKENPQFIRKMKSYGEFPLTVFKGIKNFTNGEISVKFKAISGRIDRAAGIAFDIKGNGDYLVIRANPLENNLIAFKLKNGKRSVIKWIRNVKTPSNIWHTLKITINGKKVEGYLNGKKYITIYTKNPISGGIGLWSKADSHVLFDDFEVIQKR